MFGRKEANGKQRNSALEKGEIKAFLGPGSHFEGKMAFDEIVRLDGAFRGEITSRDTLIVGETADIQAQVLVGTLIVSGKIRGNIKAVSRVEMRAPAQIDGDVETPSLIVEEGVIWNGQLIMKQGEKSKKNEAGVLPTP
ncbi:MAG: polymer-forming cytoskeletal protein [Desulfuromonadales bacterium]|nr:polymer-forming cytoskeletal protein [Desulfuromonadales bacterium]